MAGKTVNSGSGDRKPSVPKQGGVAKAPTQAPRTSGVPGGFQKPTPQLDKSQSGVAPRGVGGSGTGANKGNSLPR